MSGTFTYVMPYAPSVTAFGGTDNVTVLPGWTYTLLSQGHDASLDNTFFGVMPSVLAVARGGANAATIVPKVALSTSATLLGLGEFNGTVYFTGAVSSAGTVPLTSSMALSFGTTNSTTYSVSAYSGAVLSVTLTGGYTVASGGTTGGLAESAMQLPLYQLVSTSGTVRGASLTSLTSPSAVLGATARAASVLPSGMLIAVGHAVVAATYEAYAMNMHHTPVQGVTPVDEVTHYTNFPFDRIVRYKNSYYGMNSTGLYLLSGLTDAGTATPWAVQTAETDFKSAQLKTVGVAYFGGRMAPASTISLYAGEGAAQPYSYTTPRGALAQNYRQPLGRGIKSRYFSLGLTGTGVLSLDNVTLDVAILNRKV